MCVCIYYVIQSGLVREVFGLLILCKYENKTSRRKALISLSLQTYHSTPTPRLPQLPYPRPRHLPSSHSQYFLPLSESVKSVRFNLVQGSTQPWGGGRNLSLWVCLCVCVWWIEQIEERIGPRRRKQTDKFNKTPLKSARRAFCFPLPHRINMRLSKSAAQRITVVYNCLIFSRLFLCSVVSQSESNYRCHHHSRWWMERMMWGSGRLIACLRGDRIDYLWNILILPLTPNWDSKKLNLNCGGNDYLRC